MVCINSIVVTQHYTIGRTSSEIPFQINVNSAPISQVYMKFNFIYLTAGNMCNHLSYNSSDTNLLDTHKMNGNFEWCRLTCCSDVIGTVY